MFKKNCENCRKKLPLATDLGMVTIILTDSNIKILLNLTFLHTNLEYIFAH